MPNSKKLLLIFLVTVVALNLSWEHQTILIQMVHLQPYYHLSAPEPFVYRILPALVYYLIMPGHRDLLTGMNEPFDSSGSIFQLLLDTVSLTLSLVFMHKIAHRLNPSIRSGVTFMFAAASALVIVIFGYYMVPNRALFYPYDFPDLCFATIIFYLCIRLEGPLEYLLAVAVFVATLNKETALFYIGLYIALRAGSANPNWSRMSGVVVASGAAFIAARSLVMWLVRTLTPGATTQNVQYEFHLAYTLEQLKNPLFLFAMLNVCSYLYIVVFLLRKRLDRTDGLILFMVAGWVAIMAMVGIVRELRIFVPASLMMFVIIARHLETVVRAFPVGASTDQGRHPIPERVPSNAAITEAPYEPKTMAARGRVRD